MKRIESDEYLDAVKEYFATIKNLLGFIGFFWKHCERLIIN